MHASRILALLLALWLGGPLSASAAPPTAQTRSSTEESAQVADVAGGTHRELGLAPLPADFEEARSGELRVVYPRGQEASLKLLEDTFKAHQPRVAQELGQDISGTITVGLGRNLAEMQALAPPGHPPPRYAIGVAYPAAGIILLSLEGHGLGAALDLESVFVHELSHVALQRATGGAALPRWFSEGVAILQAREQTVMRIQTLLDASMKGGIHPLHELDARFSGRAFEVNVAYAQAADLVGFLEKEDESGRKLQRLVARLRKGDSFEDALEKSHYLNLAGLELEWRKDLDSRYGTLPLVIGGSLVWGAASVLLVFAYRKRRRQQKAGVARMGREEAVIERLEALAAARLRELEATEQQEGLDEAETLDDLSSPVAPRSEDAVPTVQHDGRSHTLH